MSLKDKLVQSDFKEVLSKEHCPAQGTFPCGHCSRCPLMRKEKSFLLPNGETFRPLHFAICQTHALVYLMLCEFNACYIGKTKRQFWRCIAKHVYNMQISNQYLPLGRHVVSEHNYKMPKISSVAIDRIHILIRDSDWNRSLLQC